MKENRHDEIKIGKQDFRFYIGQCNIKFRIFDQIDLLASENFKQNMVHVWEGMSGFGVKVRKEFKIKDAEGNEVIKLMPEIHKIKDEKTGRIQNKTLYRLGLTKPPELFMYTYGDKLAPFENVEEVD